MRILYVGSTAEDYGIDTLYDGFCRVLGPENVIEYPYRKSYHVGDGDRYINYPLLFKYPVTKTEEETLEMLRANEFDFIVVGCRKHIDFRRPGDEEKYEDVYKLLKEKSSEIPTFAVDQGDHFLINYNILNDWNIKLYFKREYMKDRHGDTEKIVPLSFSYSKAYIPNSVDTPRNNDVFWAGRITMKKRREHLKAVKEVVGDRDLSKWYTQEEYKQKLLGYKIGLSLVGRGQDTVRYWEVPAHGAMLFSEVPNIHIENNFVDGESAVFFSSIEEMKEKLRFYLDNESEVDRIRLNGHKHLLKYHTSDKRAQEVIGRMGLWVS